jgi:hypothetical protein
MRGALALALALCAAPVAAERELSTLYDPAALEQWQPRYERSTRRILDEVIAPVLLSEEKQRLGALRIEFPLYADGIRKEQVLAFYATSGAPRVVMPILSLHFLDDLCTAYAWLQVNGYGLETVSEYNAMLRYHDFPGGRAPGPLVALQIPANALQDRRVDSLALGHFVTARTWILLHELGHIYYGHRATTFAESRANEEEADRFAATVMKRTPLPPLGALVFFLADAQWAGYPSAATDTHPLSGARLRALAREVDDSDMRRALAILGEQLDDADVRSGFAATGKAGDLGALAPRRPGALPALTTVPAAAATAFHGSYRGQAAQSGEPPFAVELALERRGDQVSGEYTFGVGVGRIMRGTVVGNALEFEWRWAGQGGRGRFVTRDNGASFAGTWGHGDSTDGAGTWNARRTP